MSQIVKILSAKATGEALVGFDDETPIYSSAAEEILEWLANGYRTRFNSQRALRKKYTYQKTYICGAEGITTESKRILDENGEPVLQYIGVTKEKPEEPIAYTDKEFRKAKPYFASLPSYLLHHAVRKENQDWFAAAKRRKTLQGKKKNGGSMPFFRARKHEGKENLRFGLYHKNGENAVLHQTGKRTGVVTITGQNQAEGFKPRSSKWSVAIKIRFSQPIRKYTSVEVNLIEGVLSFTSPPPTLEKPQEAKDLTGTDFNVTRESAIALSDGRFFERPSTKSLDKKAAQHQRRMARKMRLNPPKDGEKYTPSKRHLAEKERFAKAKRKKKNVLNDWRQQVTTEIVRTTHHLAVEKLQPKNMMKSAKGTKENPGKNVAQKRGLNRGLADAAFAELTRLLRYKQKQTEYHLFDVNPKNTSRKCSNKECGHVAKESREKQAVFSCVKCGHKAHADTNASVNVEDRGRVQLEKLLSNIAEPGNLSDSPLSLDKNWGWTSPARETGNKTLKASAAKATLGAQPKGIQPPLLTTV